MEESYCEALKMAYEFEVEGAEEYRRARQQATDRFAQEALDFLIKEEMEHIRKIDTFNRHLLGRADFDMKAECSSTISRRAKEMVESTVNREAERVSARSSDVDIYDVALDLEKRGFEMYSRMLEETDDPPVQEFLQFLVEEENVHYSLIQQSKKYLQDPSYYFEDAGGWIFG